LENGVIINAPGLDRKHALFVHFACMPASAALGKYAKNGPQVLVTEPAAKTQIKII